MPRLRHTLAPLDGATPQEWRLKGACRDYDPDMWHAEPDDPAKTTKTEAAKAICWHCPVRVECLGWALAGNMSGVWGATTELQRHRLLWRRTRTYCPVCQSSMVVDERVGPRKGQVCVACGTSWTS